MDVLCHLLSQGHNHTKDNPLASSGIKNGGQREHALKEVASRGREMENKPLIR